MFRQQQVGHLPADRLDRRVAGQLFALAVEEEDFSFQVDLEHEHSGRVEDLRGKITLLAKFLV